MSDDPTGYELERNFYAEAQAILHGTSLMQPELRHLEAMEEMKEITIIRFVNALELVKQQFLNGKE